MSARYACMCMYCMYVGEYMKRTVQLPWDTAQ